MKLKDRVFPFWAVVRLHRKESYNKEYEIVRIVSVKERFSSLSYSVDAKMKATESHSKWYGHTVKLFRTAVYSKTTVSGYREVSSLPSLGKQFFIKELFKEDKWL